MLSLCSIKYIICVNHTFDPLRHVVFVQIELKLSSMLCSPTELRESVTEQQQAVRQATYLTPSPVINCTRMTSCTRMHIRH